MNEIEIISKLDHKNIVKLNYVNLNGLCKYSNGSITSKVYYSMELVSNGELFNFIKVTPKFSDKLTRFFFH